MSLHKRKIALAVVFLIGLLAVGVYVAAHTLLPTYRYYGRELSPVEMINRHDQAIPLHCVQRATEYAILHYHADLFECFDTAKEASQFSQAIRPQNDRLEADVQRRIDEGLLVRPFTLPSPVEP